MNRKRLVFLLKKVFCTFLIYSGICRVFAFIHRNRVKILVYHGILSGDLPAGLNNEDLHISRESFEKQIAYLRRHYHILGLNEFFEYLRGTTLLPKYGVVLTFDDGYKNNYENLKNMILRYKIPVTIFLVTDYAGTPELLWLDKLEMAFFNTRRKAISSLQSMGIKRLEWANDKEKMERHVILKSRLKKLPYDKLQAALNGLFPELAAGTQDNSSRSRPDVAYTRLMNWDEVKELEGYGVSFGSHTCGHEILTALPQEKMEGTLRKSLSILKNYCPDSAIPLAYPNGDFNDGVKKAAEEAGYNCALTTEHGFNSKGSDLYTLRRNEVGNKGDIHIFIAALSGVLDFLKSLAGR